MKHLILVVGVLLLVGFVISLRAPLPTLAPAATAKAPADELWTLNPE